MHAFVALCVVQRVIGALSLVSGGVGLQGLVGWLLFMCVTMLMLLYPIFSCRLLPMLVVNMPHPVPPTGFNMDHGILLYVPGV